MLVPREPFIRHPCNDIIACFQCLSGTFIVFSFHSSVYEEKASVFKHYVNLGVLILVWWLMHILKVLTCTYYKNTQNSL